MQMFQRRKTVDEDCVGPCTCAYIYVHAYLEGSEIKVTLNFSLCKPRSSTGDS